MLLQLTTTHRPATDLGYLLHKHPSRVQSTNLAFGKAHVFYPEVGDDRCTAALLLDVDPVAMVRDHRGGADGPLAQYVNDRPFVASSFLSVAIAQVFGSALGGRSKDRPELATQPMPLRARLSSVPCRGGAALLRGLFEPLGYAVTATASALDDTAPEWGRSPYQQVELARTCRLSELLQHLYVLVPVLDNDKHYWVGDEEVEKLLRHASQWLPEHPLKAQIVQRYLKYQHRLTSAAMSRLCDDEAVEEAGLEHSAEEEGLERPLALNTRRLDAVVAALQQLGARSVVDLGCGEGKLLARLLGERSFERLLGVDVAALALQRAAERLRLERMPELQRRRIELRHGSLTYRDRSLQGFDAAVAIEVIEHLEPHRLAVFTHNLLGNIDAPVTIVTTPNRDYNVRLPGLADGRLRHRDHRFEWTRQEFAAWASAAATQHRREVEIRPVGDVDAECGAPTQLAVFTRRDGA